MNPPLNPPPYDLNLTTQGESDRCERWESAKQKQSKSKAKALPIDQVAPKILKLHSESKRVAQDFLAQSKSKAKPKQQQSKAKQKQSKSNCDATHVTCYPRAGVPHVTPRRACHMLPMIMDDDG